jgi:hypothetical protein
MTVRRPTCKAQPKSRLVSEIFLFVRYCLLTVLIALAVGAAVSLPFSAHVQPWAWAGVTLLCSAGFGLTWETFHQAIHRLSESAFYS